MRPRTAVPACLALAAAVVAATPGWAQSLAGSGGLGVPLDAVGARSRALGSQGVGLFGPSLIPADPASAADLAVPTVTFTIQTSWTTSEGPTDPDAVGTRFPVVGIAYPVQGHGVATLSFGGFLDQSWRVEDEERIDLGESQARVTDLFASDGGVSVIRLGFSRRLTPSLAVGVAAGSYVGDVTRSYTRRFDSLALETSIPPLSLGGRWDFSGPTLSAGAQLDVGEFLRMAGSLTWSGSLHAKPSDDTDGGPADWDIPTVVRVGASGALTESVNLVAGFGYADWSASGVGEPNGGTTAYDFGVGLEWEGGSFLGRQSPIRLGYAKTRMPFRFQGSEATESIWSGGLGLNLVQAIDLPLARLDLAVERGDRSAGLLSERFWRASVTIRVAGF